MVRFYLYGKTNNGFTMYGLEYHSVFPMVAPKYPLQTISTLLQRNDPFNALPNSHKAQNSWKGAVAAVDSLLSSHTSGIIFCGPVSFFSNIDLSSHLHQGIFTSKAFEPRGLVAGEQTAPIITNNIELPLFPNDPIAKEHFCLIITPDFSLVMVLAGDMFQFSFAPEVIQQTWELLRTRLILTQHPHLEYLTGLVEELNPPPPDYRLVSNFTRTLLQHLSFPSTNTSAPPQSSSEEELLQALTHEIRTPLTTIRVLTQLLLKKRRQLTKEIVHRLELIDQECSEQIGRMELIFRATELKGGNPMDSCSHLVAISLEQVLQQNIPQWQKLAQKRNLTLQVMVPKKLPQVLSEPCMLEQMLGSIVERLVRKLPSGGNITLEALTAGTQLKLQFAASSPYPIHSHKSLGRLLSVQPETGSLTLHPEVTKTLFHTLGGKVILKQRSPQEEVITIFLPIFTGIDPLTELTFTSEDVTYKC